MWVIEAGDFGTAGAHTEIPVAASIATGNGTAGATVIPDSNILLGSVANDIKVVAIDLDNPTSQHSFDVASPGARLAVAATNRGGVVGYIPNTGVVDNSANPLEMLVDGKVTVIDVTTP